MLNEPLLEYINVKYKHNIGGIFRPVAVICTRCSGLIQFNYEHIRGVLTSQLDNVYAIYI